jgi:hypothetical protein
VVLDTGEELLKAALGESSSLAAAARSIDPFIVPYDRLARIDGWVLWLGHPPVPDGVQLLPAPDYLIWDEPATALAAAAAVAADYAARRGAVNAWSMKATLERESPLAVVVPGEVSAGLRRDLDALGQIGVPIVERSADASATPAFVRRRSGHAAAIGRPHDPALAFQRFVSIGRIGRNAQSSFVLHNEGERDGVTVSGEFGERVGIEVGLDGGEFGIAATVELERQAAEMPSFLNGVSSRAIGQALEIGWRMEARPSGEEIGEAIRTWLNVLCNASLVDVRIVFAPPRARAPELTAMRARARNFRFLREGATTGSPGLLRPSIEDGVD